MKKRNFLWMLQLLIAVMLWCILPSRGIAQNDEVTGVEQFIDFLLNEIGADTTCLSNVPDFASVEDLVVFLQEECHISITIQDGNLENVSDSTEVAMLVEALIADGYGECFENAPEFTNVDAVYEYLEETCDLWNGGGNPWGETDSTEVAILVEALIADGYGECFENAPEFTEVFDVFDFLEQTCDLWDSEGNPWGSTDSIISIKIEQLIALGYGECFENAPEFTNVDAIYEYLEETCDLWNGGGNPWGETDSTEVAMLIEALIADGYGECFENAPEFTNVDAVYGYLEETCDLWNNSWEDNDSTSVAILVEALIADGYGECFENAPEFAEIDDVFNFLDETCDLWNNSWEDNDSTSVAILIEALIAEGYGECFEDGLGFANVDAVYEYLEETCDLWNGGGNPWGETDTTEVAMLVEALIADGYGECFENAPEFTEVFDVFDFLEQTCDLWDSEGNPWGSTDSIISVKIEQLIALGYGECFENAPEFTNIDAIYEYLEETCDLWNGGGNPWGETDSTEVAMLIEALIADGYGECFENAPEFINVDAVYGYLEETCYLWNWGGTDVTMLLDSLIAIGYGECLIDAPAFESTDALIDYLAQNCEAFIDDYTWSVEDEQEWLEEHGYGECLANAPEFSSIDELYNYLEDNCDDFGYEIEIPECLLNIDEVMTFQAFIQYLSANCGEEYITGLPQCFLEAPIFDTNEEFFAWVGENCMGEGLIAAETDGDMPIPANLDAFRLYVAATAQANSPTGVQQELNILPVSIVPNPANSQSTIKAAVAIKQYEVYDLLGKNILSADNLNTTSAVVSLGSLSNGQYFIRITATDGMIATKKLIVQH